VKFAYYILNTYIPEFDGPAAAVYDHYFEQVETAEAVGFDAVWVTEHHFSHYGGLTPNPQLLLTAISQRTRRLRLGSSVSVLPLHHPLRIAEDFAMLDVLSGGRLEFGAGRGMVHSGYGGYGLSWADAQDRLKEALGLVERLWTEPAVTFEGRYYRCQDVTVLPRPIQQPRPPIWMPANADLVSFRWAGEHGYNLMTVPWVFPYETTDAGLQAYREARAAAGHAGPGRIVAVYPCHVAETSAQAKVQAEAPLAQAHRGRAPPGPSLARARPAPGAVQLRGHRRRPSRALWRPPGVYRRGALGDRSPRRHRHGPRLPLRRH
jgi:alkanesulfonate monooxygenase SsuD/methylene tetrahydromethanopterin reductase-like flavin-dependent oxidoreductase (luciferase family)